MHFLIADLGVEPRYKAYETPPSAGPSAVVMVGVEPTLCGF